MPRHYCVLGEGSKCIKGQLVGRSGRCNGVCPCCGTNNNIPLVRILWKNELTINTMLQTQQHEAPFRFVSFSFDLSSCDYVINRVYR